jgi:hypothetical protein
LIRYENGSSKPSHQHRSNCISYQRSIAAAIADSNIERITLLIALVGYTAMMTATLAHFMCVSPQAFWAV